MKLALSLNVFAKEVFCCTINIVCLDRFGMTINLPDLCRCVRGILPEDLRSEERLQRRPQPLVVRGRQVLGEEPQSLKTAGYQPLLLEFALFRVFDPEGH